MCHFVATGEDNSSFDGSLDGAIEIIRRAASGCHMQSRFAAKIPRVEDLEDVELTTARGPARTVGISAVLGCQRDLGVVEPDGWHVAVEASLAGEGHREFHEENLMIATKAIYYTY